MTREHAKAGARWLAFLTSIAAGLLMAGPIAAIAAPPVSTVTAASTAADRQTIAGGFGFSLVIGRDGKPYGTGDNGFGQLTGTGTRSTLTAMAGLPARVNATAVAAGGRHSLVLGSNGVVYGTGDDVYGQLTGSGIQQRATLTPLTGLPQGVKAVGVSAGRLHSLVLGSNGVAYGAGYGAVGEITGTADRSTLTLLTGLPAGVRAIEVAAGSDHSLVRGSDAAVYGTGSNADGQLTGTSNSLDTLTALAGLTVPVTAIAAGGQDSLLLGSNGVVYGAGENTEGQLTGTGISRNTLTALIGLPQGVRATAVASGDDDSVVLGSDGTAYGAGNNIEGQLTGTGGGFRDTLIPLSQHVSGGIKALAGGDYHSLARDGRGVVYGAGDNEFGQLTSAAGTTA